VVEYRKLLTLQKATPDLHQLQTGYLTGLVGINIMLAKSTKNRKRVLKHFIEKS
jgi:hypothetical protein